MIEPTAFQLRERLHRGEVSARELTEQALGRIERIEREHSLGAFISVQAELALEAADAADRLIASTPPAMRHTLPPLIGLPTAHKDLVRVSGVATTSGSAALPHTIAKKDEAIAAAVRAAGAVCLGKTQVPEFGIAAYSENLISAPARNPFDRERTAGGSSGGTAAAIASGMIPAAIGSDAGGSIRIPAAACGLIGLKPGRGAVPADARLSELDDFGVPRMSVSGPLARTARDAALFYDAISSPILQASRAEDPGAPHPNSTFGPGAPAGTSDDTAQHTAQHSAHGAALAAVQRAGELRGLRIGVSLASPFESRMPILFDDEAIAALNRAVARLESLGHSAEEAAIDYDPRYPDAFGDVWVQTLTQLSLTAEAEERLTPLTRWSLEHARSVSAGRVAEGAAMLRKFAVDAARQWGTYDAVLTPSLAFAAPEIGEFVRQGPEGDFRLQCQWVPQTSMVNVAGVPAISVPMGFDATGMPRGVQLIGRGGSEVLLLQLAEQLTNG